MGTPQRAIERYTLKFGELITARVHIGTAALAKALKAVSGKVTSVSDQWHLALTEISMDINRGLQGCRLTMLAADPGLLSQCTIMHFLEHPGFYSITSLVFTN